MALHKSSTQHRYQSTTRNADETRGRTGHRARNPPQLTNGGAPNCGRLACSFFGERRLCLSWECFFGILASTNMRLQWCPMPVEKQKHTLNNKGKLVGGMGENIDPLEASHRPKGSGWTTFTRPDPSHDLPDRHLGSSRRPQKIIQVSPTFGG